MKVDFIFQKARRSTTPISPSVKYFRSIKTASVSAKSAIEIKICWKSLINAVLKCLNFFQSYEQKQNNVIDVIAILSHI